MSLPTPYMLRTVCLVVFVMLSACAHSVHQVYVGTMDQNASYKNGRWVKADASDYVIFFFAFDSNYVEQGVSELEKQCPGRIAQVTTEHLTSYRFLSYYQKVVLKGWCRA